MSLEAVELEKKIKNQMSTKTDGYEDNERDSQSAMTLMNTKLKRKERMQENEGHEDTILLKSLSTPRGMPLFYKEK